MPRRAAHARMDLPWLLWPSAGRWGGRLPRCAALRLLRRACSIPPSAPRSLWHPCVPPCTPRAARTAGTVPPVSQFYPEELYPPELEVKWEEISACFQSTFVPKLQVGCGCRAAACACLCGSWGGCAAWGPLSPPPLVHRRPAAVPPPPPPPRTHLGASLSVPKPVPSGSSGLGAGRHQGRHQEGLHRGRQERPAGVRARRRRGGRRRGADQREGCACGAAEQREGRRG